MTILKQFDFEVPGFGEFDAPPTSAALTQATGVGPPQLPGQTALRIDTAGGPGTLTYDLGTPTNILHTRLMFNAASCTGGLIILAGTSNATNASVWLLALDADNRQLSLSAGSKVRTVDLPAERLS